MNDEWKRKLLQAAARSDETQEQEFLELVDQADGNCSLDVVRVLMKTFSSKPDYGTQERVESILATAKPEHVTRGILEELPRLVVEAPEWAETLVGMEVDNRLDLLISVAKTMPENVKDCLCKLVYSEPFLDFYPNGKDFKLT